MNIHSGLIMDTTKLKKIEKNEFLKKVYLYAVESLELNRRDARIFFRLQGLLLKDDLPVTYPTAKLAEKEQYSTRSVDRALNSLESLGLIERMGCSYRRRFKKGVKLIGIIIEMQNSTNL